MDSRETPDLAAGASLLRAISRTSTRPVARSSRQSSDCTSRRGTLARPSPGSIETTPKATNLESVRLTLDSARCVRLAKSATDLTVPEAISSLVRRRAQPRHRTNGRKAAQVASPPVIQVSRFLRLLVDGLLRS